jgi:hypothetical protein
VRDVVAVKMEREIAPPFDDLPLHEHDVKMHDVMLSLFDEFRWNNIAPPFVPPVDPIDVKLESERVKSTFEVGDWKIVGPSPDD